MGKEQCSQHQVLEIINSMVQSSSAVTDLVKKFPTFMEPKNGQICGAHKNIKQDSSLLGWNAVSTKK